MDCVLDVAFLSPFDDFTVAFAVNKTPTFKSMSHKYCIMYKTT